MGITVINMQATLHFINWGVNVLKYKQYKISIFNTFKLNIRNTKTEINWIIKSYTFVVHIYDIYSKYYKIL